MSQKKHLVAVAGVIGVGKSTLVNSLSEALGWEQFQEPVENNPYLDLFYKDMHSYSFAMQLHMLNARYEMTRAFMNGDKSSVMDRSITEDSIFAKMLNTSGHISDLDYDLYTRSLSNLSENLQKPDVIIYLKVSPEIAMERIRGRGRKCEEGITKEYITNLCAGYDAWSRSATATSPVLQVDWSEFRPTKDVAEIISTHFDSLEITENRRFF